MMLSPTVHPTAMQRKAHGSGGGLPSSSFAATNRAVRDCCSPSALSASTTMADEKYLKCRDHRRRERRRRAMATLLAALVVLFFTYRQVRRDPSLGASGDDDGAEQRRGGRPHPPSERHGADRNGRPPPKRDPRKGRERMRSQLQEEQEREGREGHDDALTTAVARRARGAVRVGDDGGRTRFDHGTAQGDDTDGRQRQYQQVAGYQRREKKEPPEAELDPEENNDGGGGFLFPWQQRKSPLQDALKAMDERVLRNEDHGIRWIDPQLVPALDSSTEDRPLLGAARRSLYKQLKASPRKEFFKATRMRLPERMEWENHDVATKGLTRDAFVDYTKHRYEYPLKLMEPPSRLGDYPKLMPLRDIMEIWPQDELDHPPETIHEELIHFDFTDPSDLEAALKFRAAKLPFKLVNVPEVVAAGERWTDEYLAKNFDTKYGLVAAEGTCQESPDNYFAWFQAAIWNVDEMGLPPTRNNDWTFERWAQHARYADRVGLGPHQPHFYWQAGVERAERRLDPSQWTFISRDLPSFSSMEPNFLLFEPKSQKGIQCRFGERGVTAATHFDGGRNMVAMVTGAKRYVLSPPRECQKLGIVTTRGNAIFRHSMLNFGHMNHMDDEAMPGGERRWMEEAGRAEALSTVLKAGEVLYIPSHWFHYITSLQKSAQCNVRSGMDMEGDAFFGGEADVTERCAR